MNEAALALSWHSLTPDAAASALSVAPETGLSEAEVAQRRADTEGAEIGEAGGGWLRLLLRQFASALVLILAAAAALSFALGDRFDAIAILAIILINAALGFIQEWRAETAIKALRRMMAPSCRVLRGGQSRVIDASELVRGDVVLLEAGDQVPADLRWLEAVDVRTDESVLTGEAASVAKSEAPAPPEAALHARSSMAWTGSILTAGRGRGVVVATGAETEFGRIAELASGADTDQTPLQRKMSAFAAQLGAGAIAAAALAGGIGWASGWSLIDALMTGVSIAVAMVPEGLPAAVTVTLALGAGAMARRQALLRRLQAAETLGASTVICTDKTGTLTQNEMTAVEFWTPGLATAIDAEADPQQVDDAGAGLAAPGPLHALLETAATCNNASLDPDGKRSGEPTEIALLAGAERFGIGAVGARLFEAPFSSDRKRMSVLVEKDGMRTVHAKGALLRILPLCTQTLTGEGPRAMEPDDKTAIHAAHARLASAGLRVIALATRVIEADTPLSADGLETDLAFIGLIGLMDPPRAESAGAVAAARSAGIKVIMITGDAAETASAIAERIGFPKVEPVEGSDLADMPDSRLSQKLVDGAVFARATPEDKIRIIALLQARGEIVAMTGDGVNDAPALKKADIGVAMGMRGTDAARGAADMVLADDNFATIVNAIEEGRRQRDNIRKFIRYLLASNLGELMAIMANLIIGGPLILLPLQILWMNLMTDGPTALALGAEPAERDTMQRRPEPANAPLLNASAMVHVIGVAALMAAAAVALFDWRLEASQDEAAARTLALTAIIAMQKANVFSYRFLARPVWAAKPWSNPWLVLAVAGTLAVQVAAVYAPPLQAVLHTTALSSQDWLLIAAASVLVLTLSETIKTVLRRAVRLGD